MDCIWNIYEPSDTEQYDQEDPFDVFLFALRKEDVPQRNSLLYVEGRQRRIIAVKVDTALSQVCGFDTVSYYKVCVV
jgi:hypothetical protein